MRGLLILCVLAAGCNEDVGGGPSFGSGASASATATAGASGTGDPAGSTSGGTSNADTSASSGSNPSGSSSDSDDPSGATEATNASTSDTSGAATTEASETGDPTSTGDSGPMSGGGTPLDPDLDVPDEGESCMFPGNLNECPGVATVCRFYSAEEGRCESCDNCGNLNAPCTQGTDCDILFSCYAGRCTNFCELGTFSCGPIENCLDIGHATHGVCDPFA